jgi:hypothetical protein
MTTVILLVLKASILGLHVFSALYLSSISRMRHGAAASELHARPGVGEDGERRQRRRALIV